MLIWEKMIGGEMTKKFFILLSVVVLMFNLGACSSNNSGSTQTTVDDDQALLNAVNPTSDLDGDGITNENDTDIDGDGLSNTEESFYGTSIYIEDTDGDGWTDYEEIERFVAAENIFNPLIADLPRIQLLLKSEPVVKMEYETTSGKTIDYSTSTTDTFEQTHTMSNSFSHSSGTEYGWSVEMGIEAGYASQGGHFLWHLTGSGHGSYTTEDSYEWGTEESYTHARSVESAKSMSSSEDLTKTGGSMTYAVAFKNTGPIAYTVDTMELSAYKIDRNTPELIGSISQSSNSSFSEFQSFQLNPGEESGLFSFRNDGLYVSDVMSLLADSSGIICAVSGYTVSMEETDFTQSGTDVPSKTAKIFIDYGPGVDRDSEQYCVATKTNINTNATTLFDLYHPVLLKDLMTSINVTYGLGGPTADGENPNNGLIAVRGIEVNAESQKYWYIAHTYTEDNVDMIALYAAHISAYDFDEITVKTGDVVQLIYSVDGDGDGIPLRVETMLGTSDELLDSDGDTLSDWDELHPDPETNPKTNPANKDTDGDGLLDYEDDDPLVAKISDDAVLVDLELSVGTITFVRDSDSDTPVREYTVTGVVSDAIHITPYAAKNACPITVTVNDEAPVDAESDVTSGEFPLEVGDNTVVITVTALDGITQETYTLHIHSELSPIAGLTASTVSETEIYLGWSVPDDSRISGIIIRSSETIELDTETPQNRLYEEGNALGNGTVISDGLESDSVEFSDDGLSNDTTYYYEVFTYNKIGSSYTWSEGVRITSSTTKRTDARLHFDLCYLKDVKTRDGDATWGEYYWDIKADGVVINSLLNNHVSLDDDDGQEYYSFYSGTRVASEPTTFLEHDGLDVERISGQQVVFYLNLYEYDGNNYDRGAGDDDVICTNAYYFTYNFDDDTWTSTMSGLTVGGPGVMTEPTVIHILSEHSDMDIRLRFWWEAL